MQSIACDNTETISLGTIKSNHLCAINSIGKVYENYSNMENQKPILLSIAFDELYNGHAK